MTGKIAGGMKKGLAVLFAVMMLSASAMADDWYDYGNADIDIEVIYEAMAVYYEETDTMYIGAKTTDSTSRKWVNEFNISKVKRWVPSSAIRDQSSTRARYNGTDVGCPGVTGSKGANLRMSMSTEKEYILRKLHEYDAVYVNFAAYDRGGTMWYYVTCADGTNGFIHSNVLLLVQ